MRKSSPEIGFLASLRLHHCEPCCLSSEPEYLERTTFRPQQWDATSLNRASHLSGGRTAREASKDPPSLGEVSSVFRLLLEARAEAESSLRRAEAAEAG